MKLVYKKKRFFFICSRKNNSIPRKAEFNYNYSGKVWWTNDILKAYKLKEYADDLLQKKLEEYINKRQKKIEESYSGYADIDIPAPDEYDYFPFQKAGIKYSLDRDKVLIADDMGLGKTIQVIGVLNSMESVDKVLIVCPNSLKYNWKKELERWLVHDDLTISVNDMTTFTPANIMIINFDAFKFASNPKNKNFKDPKKGEFNPTFHLMKDLKKLKKIDVLVVDESHKLKNWSANTTRNIFKLKNQVSRMLFLSGTPIMGKIEELWTTIKIFGFQHVFGRNKDEFMRNWCGATWNPFMRRYESNPDKITDEIFKRLQENLRIHFMIRRTKKQVLKELPEKIRSIVPLQIDRKYLEQYDHLTQDVVDASKLNNNAESSILSSLRPQQIQEVTEMRKVTGQLKIMPSYHFIKDMVDAGEKVVVFGHHVEVLEQLYHKFKKTAVLVKGGIKPEDRQKAVDLFQESDDINVFIGQNDVASLGITLTASSNVVIVESSWTPSINVQIEDRCLRYGQKNAVNVYYLVIDKSIDAHIIQTVIRKQDLFDKVIENESIL